MKIFSCTLILVASVLFISCDKEDSPVSDQTKNQRKISIYPYGSSLDSAYYKVWSDSSWNKFGQVAIINGIVYITIVSNTGEEYYYNADGFAGVKPYGQSFILFDTPISSFPDTIVFGQKYTQQTTFSVQGYSYSMKIEQTLQDTMSVTVPFGTFNPCLWFKSTSTTTVADQSIINNGEFWLAIGPSDIQQTSNSGTTIQMVRGFVNGTNWGTTGVIALPNLLKKHNLFSINNLLKQTTHYIRKGKV